MATSEHDGETVVVGGRPAPGAARVVRVMLVSAAVITAGTALVGWFTVAVLDGSWIGDTSREVPAWLAGHRSDVLDTLATGSRLTDGWTIVALVAGAAGMLVATGHRRHAAFLVLGLLTEVAVHLVVSEVIGRARPDVVPAGGEAVPFTASFPSGHVAVAVVVYGAMAVLVADLTGDDGARRIMTGAVVVVATVVAAARLYLGVHDVIDVVAGAGMGAAVLAATRRALGPLGPADTNACSLVNR